MKVKFYYGNRITEIRECADRDDAEKYRVRTKATLFEVLREPFVPSPPLYQQLTPTGGVEIQHIKGQ